MDTEKKMHSGMLYLPNDDKIVKKQLKCLKRLQKFNKKVTTNLKRREKMLKKMFASVGNNCYIEPPFYANFGGYNCHLGDNVYINFNLTMVDDTNIYIGSNTMIGPNVTIATAGHPILPELREKGYQYNLPVHIGKNCWLGANVIVLPGVTIGDNSVIGAGSVVNKDIPSNVVAVGNPCKVLRQINDNDKKYYYKDKLIEI